MAPMQPPPPRPISPGFVRNDNNSMPNTGWRNAYQNLGSNGYMDNTRPSLPGFYISDPNNISARDVPMDGSISFFPASDLSYIIIKQWNGNGMISEAKYIPAPVVAKEEQQQQQDQENDSQNTDQQNTSHNSEVVEVISAALNEQTQRLTAAFSQIGMAFTALQEKLDHIGSQASFPPPAPVMVSPEVAPINPGKQKNGKKGLEEVKNEKE